MSHEALSGFVEAAAAKSGIPGVAVGVRADGREVYACRGVTSIDNPLPVDQDTLFVLGSVTKTYTATALMRLVAEGRVELDAPVRRYVPELRLADEQTAAQVTVLNLLNHTSGLGWDLLLDTGEGDDALASFVAKLAELELIAPPGARASYSQAGYSLLGRVIEKVAGLPYEKAIASLVFAPLGLSHSFFAPVDVMTRRFAVGHNRGEDGTLSIGRLWRGPRCRNPGGGLASSVADQLRWARFHLGDGRGESGERVLPAEVLHRMKEPTAELRGSTLGDAFGICWFLRDVDGVRTVGHGGSANGQFAELLTVPERGFAVVALSNAGPDGIPFNQAVVRWALRELPGGDRPGPRAPPVRRSAGPGVRRALRERRHGRQHRHRWGSDDARGRHQAADPGGGGRGAAPGYPREEIGLLPGDGDEYIITSGGMKGMRGFFTRDDSGAVAGIDAGGRMYRRVPTASGIAAPGVLRVYWRVSFSPGRGLLELAGDPDEYVLPPVGGGQLHADRQAGGCPVQGEADGRLAGHIELRGVRDEADDALPFLLWPGSGEPAQLGRGRAEGRRHEQVMVVPPVRHAARPHPEPHPALQVGHRTERLAGPPVAGVARFDLVLADRAAEQHLEGLECRFGVGRDDRAEVPDELRLEHGRGRGRLDVVAERLQQPRRAGHRGTALRIVEETLRAWPVQHPDPQPARIGTTSWTSGRGSGGA